MKAELFLQNFVPPPATAAFGLASPSSSSFSLESSSSPSPSSEETNCLSVIALHRRLGERSLCKLKARVRRFAEEHTFKETARAFGVHHSTVSGWVKAATKAGQNQHTPSVRYSVKFDDRYSLKTRHCSLRTGSQR